MDRYTVEITYNNGSIHTLKCESSSFDSVIAAQKKWFTEHIHNIRSHEYYNVRTRYFKNNHEFAA